MRSCHGCVALLGSWQRKVSSLLQLNFVFSGCRCWPVLHLSTWMYWSSTKSQFYSFSCMGSLWIFTFHNCSAWKSVWRVNKDQNAHPFHSRPDYVGGASIGSGAGGSSLLADDMYTPVVYLYSCRVPPAHFTVDSEIFDVRSSLSRVASLCF